MKTALGTRLRSTPARQAAKRLQDGTSQRIGEKSCVTQRGSSSAIQHRSIPQVNVYDRSGRLVGTVLGVDFEKLEVTSRRRRRTTDRWPARAHSPGRIRIQ